MAFLPVHRVEELFPTGMWNRERQPRSGNWHAHSVVNVGWDIKTGFPFDQVKSYLHGMCTPVSGALEGCGSEWPPAVSGALTYFPSIFGPACARYLTKYLGKAFSMEKQRGK